MSEIEWTSRNAFLGLADTPNRKVRWEDVYVMN